MEWDRIEAQWLQLKGNVKTHWARLTDGQIDAIAGRREAFAGGIQQAYGVTSDAAMRQLDVWQKSLKDGPDQPAAP